MNFIVKMISSIPQLHPEIYADEICYVQKDVLKFCLYFQGVS